MFAARSLDSFLGLVCSVFSFDHLAILAFAQRRSHHFGNSVDLSAMPYESFKSSQHVSIRGLVQDRKTGSWRYLLQVTRNMQDDAFGAKPLEQTTSPTCKFPTRPCTTQSYAIRRSFEDFKKLHEAIAPLMTRGGKSQLPKLPNDSLLTFFVGETQTALQKKRLALERVLAAIEANPAASEAPEYSEFVANINSYDQVAKAPLSPSISSRSSFSFSEDGTMTPRDMGVVGPNVLTTSRSANALRRAYFQHDNTKWRSADDIEVRDQENHVAFSHFSMT
ncbi:hypothetical protein BBO99_00006812 [Phytophthora kernoviae]|uniref:PX domain-containing protein n=2 Tax=Phytophthora kernoviae TaxID=325452 RepID=A0A3R7FX28_9STRA|nr:hypothetical protein G195_010807 [Phytophthora kernoviae 00238/432]KAG2521101.1 hypothetical protein JM16_006443 [Phytophthora kernoviae]KAG2521762.1 hypothetical protein JM18_006464 [Phytophthora kernoviae]RLM96882.1 hypothetical protein BBI17_006830 [Phytophthora kernoviae]RLN77352.1 hypothetical protein BBO99_00006812 [Phytophthora kernoviae]